MKTFSLVIGVTAIFLFELPAFPSDWDTIEISSPSPDYLYRELGNGDWYGISVRRIYGDASQGGGYRYVYAELCDPDVGTSVVLARSYTNRRWRQVYEWAPGRTPPVSTPTADAGGSYDYDGAVYMRPSFGPEESLSACSLRFLTTACDDEDEIDRRYAAKVEDDEEVHVSITTTGVGFSWVYSHDADWYTGVGAYPSAGASDADRFWVVNVEAYLSFAEARVELKGDDEWADAETDFWVDLDPGLGQSGKAPRKKTSVTDWMIHD